MVNKYCQYNLPITLNIFYSNNNITGPIFGFLIPNLGTSSIHPIERTFALGQRNYNARSGFVPKILLEIVLDCILP